MMKKEIKLKRYQINFFKACRKHGETDEQILKSAAKLLDGEYYMKLKKMVLEGEI